jgi:chemotaxis protein methyltransferase CheR
VTPLEYDFLRRSLKEQSGLVLSADKQYLVESRLLPIARKAGFVSLSALVAALRRGDESLMMTVVEAMTTNETFFFRDKAPFENFRTAILPVLLAARRASRHIRIWSAAASTGQEPYSLAMILRELGDTLDGWHIEIVATDLSGVVLQKAQAGIYSQFEVQRGLPIAFLIKYFSKVGDMWQIAPELRAMVKFRKFNLLADFSSFGAFDLIFCRNVLIYFDQPTKTSVLNRLSRIAAADSYLILGAAETVVGLTDSFRTLPELRGVSVPNVRSPWPQVVSASRAVPRLVAVGGGR